MTAVKLLYLTHQGLTGPDLDAMPSLMVASIAAEIFEFEIRVMEVGGAIKDAFGGLLQAVQIPTGDVAGVA